MLSTRTGSLAKASFCKAQGILRRYTVLPRRQRVTAPAPPRASTRHSALQPRKLRNMSDKDIEELHLLAILQGSTTYVDPQTGFTVFTELAHLQRGQCCGSQCRHCPYGWMHVRTGERRTAVVTTAEEKGGVQARLQELREAQRDYQLLRLQQPKPAAAAAAAANGASSHAATQKKTGGRHGGRLTSKNVPYTRGGDTGMSSLLTGERRSKTDDAFEAMGTIDELCSFVGVAHAEWEREIIQSSTIRDEQASGTNDDDNYDNKALRLFLLEVMSRLFDIGSHVAKPPRKSRRSSGSNTSDDDEDDDDSVIEFIADGVGGGFDQRHVEELEDWIDQLTDDLPELRSFILPTGSPTAAQLHVCRCVCRRAERRVIPLVQEQGVCDPTALQYLNRLSDFFFSAARWVNLNSVAVSESGRQREEIQYRRPTRSSKQRDRVSVSLDPKR